MQELLYFVHALLRWSWCAGCGEHTTQKKITEGWLCPCGYINIK